MEANHERVGSVAEQARRLAEENREADGQIQGVYWFDHAHQVRLVELHAGVPRLDGEDLTIEPVYFPAEPANGLPYPSGIALIHPADLEHARLPESWGQWADAHELGGGR